MIDGAGSLQILRRIFLPAVVPAIITVVLFAFIMSWNEFLGALVMMTDGAKFTLPLILANVPHGDVARGHRLGDAAGRDHDLDHPVRRRLPAAAALLRVRAADGSGEMTSTALSGRTRAAAGCGRSASARSRSPAASGRGASRSTPRRRWPTARAGWSGSAGSANFTPRGRRHDRRQPPGDDVRRLRRVQADGGDGVGGRPLRVGRRRRAASRELTAMIAPAQEPDGYLNTVFGRPGQPPRYSDLEWGHELYNDGHLLQAGGGAGRGRRATTSSSTSPGASPTTCATTFGRRRHRARRRPPGDRARARRAGPRDRASSATSTRRRCSSSGAAAARSARSGSGRRTSRTTCRSATPTVFRGHAVRALYLAAGAVDVAVETGDDELLGARRRPVGGDASPGAPTSPAGWARSTPARRSATTSCCPPDRAYSETCAGIASVMLAWRLLLATGEPRFADLIERTLYNVVATSPAPDGRHFFYANPLHQRVPGHACRATTSRASGRRRACASRGSSSPAARPTWPARWPASPRYLATADDDGIQIHQYADAASRTTLDDGRRVGVEVTHRLSRTTARSPCGSPRPTGSRGRSRLRVPAVGDRRRGGRRRPAAAGRARHRRRRAAVRGRRRGDAARCR